jgi:ATP-dependent helicase/nuclease subunit A
MTADLLAADRAARRAAQTRFDVPLVLQAGAGTGKTTTLIGRLLAWALGEGWERATQRLAERAAGKPREEGPDRIAAEVLGRVVAITFTEAAAAEMAGRTARELASLASGTEAPDWLAASILPPNPERARRAQALLGTLDHLAVRTIHAFCRGLLADYPLEARVHPDLAVDADGHVLEEVVRETVEDALRDGYGDPGDPHLLALAIRGFGPPEIVEALGSLLQGGIPAAVLAEDPFRPEALAAFRRRLHQACGTIHGLIAPRLVRAKRPSNAKKIADAAATLLLKLEGEATVQDLKEACVSLFPGNLVDHLKTWRHKLGDTETSLFGDVQEELSAAAGAFVQLVEHLSRFDPELLDHGRRALTPLLGRIERELRSQGIATFDFLLAGAESLLAQSFEVRRQVRRRIDQLLVDEFQDTDRVQCELLRWIALDGPLEERPGLFLVGDPKQSIYGWRNADLKAYDGFVALVREAGGEVMSLVLNFRSVPAILEEVARVVEPVMEPRLGVQPPFEPLLPSRDAPGFRRRGGSSSQGAAWEPVEHWVSWKREEAWKTPTVEATEIEAVFLAEDIRELHERHGVAWSEIAVLLRGIGDLDLYLEAFRRARVPFAVGRDKQYYRRR